MRGIGTLITVVLVIAGACNLPERARNNWKDREGELFVTGPYLMVGAPGEVFVAMKGRPSDRPMVVWWPEGDGLQAESRVEATYADGLWVARLQQLPIGPRIIYRVASRRGVTPPRTFRAGARDDDVFRFAVYGDTRTGHWVHRQVVEAAARENLDFVLHTGDMVERGGIEQQWDTFFQIERPLLVSTPILPSIGNHDLSARHNYRQYFLHALWAKDRNYFVKDWGRLRIVAMDGNVECRTGCAQYAFVEQALAQGAERGMFLVMMLHFPPYSSGAHGSHTGVQKTVTAFARKYGVELVVAGHDHNYERTVEIDGTTYIVSGSAGAPIKPVHPRSFTAEARTEPHYVLVDVERDVMILRAINLRGETFDSFVIRRNEPRAEQ